MEHNSENFSFSPTDPDSDATMARYQKRLLEQLSKNGKDPVLSEMAREMLAGHLTIQQAFDNKAYAEAMISAGRTTALKFAEMPEEELVAAYREGQAVLDQLDADDAETPDATTPNTEPPTGNPARADNDPDDTDPMDDDPIESFLIDPIAR